MRSYRICQATSGAYYVQRLGPVGYKKVGPFFRTFRGAETLVTDLKFQQPVLYPAHGRVVQYY